MTLTIDQYIILTGIILPIIIAAIYKKRHSSSPPPSPTTNISTDKLNSELRESDKIHTTQNIHIEYIQKDLENLKKSVDNLEANYFHINMDNDSFKLQIFEIKELINNLSKKVNHKK